MSIPPTNPHPPTPPLPAYETKHHPTLSYHLPHLSEPLILYQNDTTHETGSTLWLSSQVLVEYLLHHFSHSKLFRSRTTLHSAPTVLELGSGTGLTSLALASLGFTVTATDTSLICASILSRNLNANAHLLPHPIAIHPLDWLSPPPPTSSSSSSQTSLLPTYDIIVASDVVYAPSLIPTLCATLARYAGMKTVVYVAQEVRVQELWEEFLRNCKEVGLVGKEVKRGVLGRVMQGRGWVEEGWEGVVVWKFTLKSKGKGEDGN